MSASTSGALKAFIEAQGLNISVYRDEAPVNTLYPYITVQEAVAITPDALEDGAAGTVMEEVTIDVWMDWKNLTTGGRSESYTLPTDVARKLEGARLTTSPTTAYAVLVKFVGPRIVDRESNNVHVPIQADVMRVL